MTRHLDETVLEVLTPPYPGTPLMVPGVIVGRGLAVATLPEVTGVRGYSLIQVGTGLGIPMGTFWRRDLAIRCARELTHLCSFEQNTPEQLLDEVGPRFPYVLMPVLHRYAHLDVRSHDQGRPEVA